MDDPVTLAGGENRLCWPRQHLYASPDELLLDVFRLGYVIRNLDGRPRLVRRRGVILIHLRDKAGPERDGGDAVLPARVVLEAAYDVAESRGQRRRVEGEVAVDAPPGLVPVIEDFPVARVSLGQGAKERAHPGPTCARGREPRLVTARALPAHPGVRPQVALV